MKEKHLYELIEKLIDASIPLWNATLAPLADKDFQRKRRIDYTKVDFDLDLTSFPEFKNPLQYSYEEGGDYPTDEWIIDNRRLIFPEPQGYFEPLPEPFPLDLKNKYGNRGLQVIVKLANIHLTPEKPKYEGGTWHVEGNMVCTFFQASGLVSNQSCIE